MVQENWLTSDVIEGLKKLEYELSDREIQEILFFFLNRLRSPKGLSIEEVDFILDENPDEDEMDFSKNIQTYIKDTFFIAEYISFFSNVKRLTFLQNVSNPQISNIPKKYKGNPQEITLEDAINHNNATYKEIVNKFLENFV